MQNKRWVSKMKNSNMPREASDMFQRGLPQENPPIPPPVPANTPTDFPDLGSLSPKKDLGPETGELVSVPDAICHMRTITLPNMSSGPQTDPPTSDVPVSAPAAMRCWQRPAVLLCFFYLVGLSTTLSHIVYYIHLSGTVAGDGYRQQSNIRIGTALAVLTQFSFVTAVWLCYTQCLWRNLQRKPMSPRALNAAFGANESILSLANTEMLRRFKLGSALALLAWCLLLPAFFTPSTLYILPSTRRSVVDQMVPQLAISNSTEGHRFAYSPPTQRNVTYLAADEPRTFAGPRTALSLVSTAASALGEILPLTAPHEHASYNTTFFGPAVRCGPANASAEALIDGFLQQKMAQPLGSARETDNAYYAFVPVRVNGTLAPVSKPRDRAPSNATNEVWISLSRYVDEDADADGGSPRQGGLRPRARQRLVCELWNASYHIAVSWDHGVQSVRGSSVPLGRVGFPAAGEAVAATDMAKHAYSALMWVITDQVVGSLSWYEDAAQGQQERTPQNNKALLPDFERWSDAKPSASRDKKPPVDRRRSVSEVSKTGASAPAPGAAQFGVIDTQLEHNVLLGCDDLDVFFDFSQRLYSFDTSRLKGLKEQRRRDKAVAGGLPLGRLIQQLAFNVTISLLHNELLTQPAKMSVEIIDDVNRYGYLVLGLLIPYALANLFTLAVVLLGCYSYFKHGPMPGKSFSDVARVLRDPEVMDSLDQSQCSLRVVEVERRLSFRCDESSGGSRKTSVWSSGEKCQL
ncbi:hypothetical protein D7B24_002402 [Verticillium nonalfalfae]|uniref:Uncharacterized protein n=1 Tax=Verticillium nonalfalfae TaxID=1051616 RepID=A0A3M9Y1P9_9PEZI|nr:uncharacterized protein D7B24_002402 [Verticillium nonalfalfae]RNJ53060.1 hypothetical protein D7B24_002402 [Verticillium nonalfalfae]